MALETTNNRVSYAGNGVTVNFSFPNYFLEEADLVVIQRVTATGVETVKTLTTHYTIVGEGLEAGGTVTMLVAPPTGTSLIIYRDPAILQDKDFRENDSFPAEQAEEAWDKAAMVSQRLAERVSRAVRLSDGFAPTFDPTLPVNLDSAVNCVPTINAAGTGWAAVADWPTATGVSAGMAASAAAAAASASAALTSQGAASTSATASAASAVASAASAVASAASAVDAAAAAATAAGFTWGGTPGGTGDAITLTPTPVLSAYALGNKYGFKAGATNTTAVTIAISGLAAKPVKTQAGAALAASSLISGRVYTITYDGTNFIVHELTTPEATVTASKTTTYSATNGDDVIPCDATAGAFTVNLPAAASNAGVALTIIKTDSSVNAITVDGNASETIDGLTTRTLNTQYESIRIICDGTTWYILENKFGLPLATYTPTFTGLGTVTVNSVSRTRLAGMLYIIGSISVGTTTGVAAQMSLPTGLVVDNGRGLNANTLIFGRWNSGTAATTKYGTLLAAGNDTTLKFAQDGANPSSSILGTAVGTSGDGIFFWAIIPIKAWNL